MIGVKETQHYHKTWNHKSRLVGKNRKTKRPEDIQPDEESDQTNSKIRQTKKKKTRMQISQAFGENKSDEQILISGHCRIRGGKTSFGNNMAKYKGNEYTDIHLIYCRTGDNGYLAQTM